MIAGHAAASRPPAHPADTDVALPSSLRVLEPIGLDEITAIADLQVREDRKYLVEVGGLAEVLATIIAADPGARALEIDGRRAFRYRSVYFDTPELDSYLGAARRRPRRFKVRTRHYLDSATCHVEVKVRDRRGRTVKHRSPHDASRDDELDLAARCFVASIDRTADVVDRLTPALRTEYHRVTVALGDGGRMTVDAGVSWRTPDGRSAALAHLVLIETKTHGRPSTADRVLWRRGRRPTSISKYCTGLALLDPTLPAHPWHRLLQRELAAAR